MAEQLRPLEWGLQEEAMHNDLVVKVKVADLLEKLRTNRDRHKAIVQEAREGYLEKAQAALKQALVQVAEGKLISLSFGLALPQDHTKEYNTVIGMLEMTSSDTLELSAFDYRRFVEDNWEWAGHFLAANSAYSATCRRLADQSNDD